MVHIIVMYFIYWSPLIDIILYRLLLYYVFVAIKSQFYVNVIIEYLLKSQRSQYLYRYL